MEIDEKDFEFFRDALNTAHFKSVSEDMTEAYRQMDVRSKTSPLTKHLQGAVDRANKYLDEVREQNKENEDVSE